VKRRLLIGLSISAASAFLFSGCAVADVVSPPFAAGIYATPADASGAPSAVALPSWIPPTATMIRIKTDETKNASILTFSLDPVVMVGPACPQNLAKQPQLNETWWPQTLPTDGYTCIDNWTINLIDGKYYAWTN
jgi:hypothetical protein